MRLLIAEDNPSDRIILANLIKRLGHEVILATDGQQAVTLFAEHRPDILLLDVLMPNKNGIQAAREIRQIAGVDLVPIIFLTSLNEASDLAECLEAGGDDFLTKPYNPVVIKAKILAFSRMRRLHTEIQRQREHLVQEQLAAKNIFDKIAHYGVLKSPNIRYLISPKAIFNGDVVLAARHPNGDLLVLLGDFTGHGLPAAIGALPLAEVFHGMVAKGFSLEDVLREVNAKLKSILPVGVFCCATAAHLGFRNRSIEVWAGGLPEGVIYNPRTKTIKQIHSKHLALGILGAAQFRYEPAYFEMDNDDIIYLWSDGIIETVNQDNEMFGFERLLDVFAKTPHQDQVFNQILADVQAFAVNKEQSDDHTLIEVKMQDAPELALEQAVLIKPKVAHRGLADYSFSCELGTDSLKLFDPVPLFTHFIHQVPGLKPYINTLNTVLAELYSNALEHGVLGLDSMLKSNAQGFAQYYKLRHEKLIALENGTIKFDIKHEPTELGGRLILQVTDSGQGFQVATLNKETDLTQQISHYHGRGLRLIRTLCQRLEIIPPGNSVIVEFDWKWL
ncbi:ATP-binding SpoIIE family protein phosphatase [Agitococcus lubricus]|uniref:Histidine kinase-like protein n=1 Tax=Agitococcus lubricus TaxID=1077255 RepID=A0A2T5IZ75_9GAMM|nr:fused response regulator/phosphatase [Agitococcus lubricus]PTQ89319.1 histidine kinase-like protein [Agitococcus lubricus]